MPIKNHNKFDLLEEREWLQQALIDISFLDNGTCGHAIISARKMEAFLDSLQAGKYPEREYFTLKEWLCRSLSTLKKQKASQLVQKYAQFGSDILS